MMQTNDANTFLSTISNFVNLRSLNQPTFSIKFHIANIYIYIYGILTIPNELR